MREPEYGRWILAIDAGNNASFKSLEGGMKIVCQRNGVPERSLDPLSVVVDTDVQDQMIGVSL